MSKLSTKVVATVVGALLTLGLAGSTANAANQRKAPTVTSHLAAAHYK